MISKELFAELQSFVEKYTNKADFYIQEAPVCAQECIYKKIEDIEIEDYIKNNRKPSFHKVLFSFIDKEHKTDSEIYKKAGIDRRLFSKIRSNPDYRPGKNTVISLALALELSKKDTEYLLSSSGYTLSYSNTFDLVIQFCLEKKIYNIFDVNIALDYFGLKPLH